VRVYTVGHSNRSLEDFLALLAGHGIRTLADIRRFRSSRRFPWFGEEALARALQERGIDYVALSELGGRRRPRPGSLNTVWEVEGFRAYADYMETPEFRAGIDRLLDLAARAPTACMCAEALWWQCHRMLVADHLKARGHEVVHLVDPVCAQPHPWSAAARRDRERGGHYARVVLGLQEGPGDPQRALP
jgi:uncharacterized protein (DUF488 family)